jgi:hypothetical protein
MAQDAVFETDYPASLSLQEPYQVLLIALNLLQQRAAWARD